MDRSRWRSRPDSLGARQELLLPSQFQLARKLDCSLADARAKAAESPSTHEAIESILCSLARQSRSVRLPCSCCPNRPPTQQAATAGTAQWWSASLLIARSSPRNPNGLQSACNPQLRSHPATFTGVAAKPVRSCWRANGVAWLDFWTHAASP